MKLQRPAGQQCPHLLQQPDPLPIWVYSETCLRLSPLGPEQLAVIQRWPVYKACIKNQLIPYIVMYIAIALTNFNVQLTSSLLILENSTNTIRLSCQLAVVRETLRLTTELTNLQDPFAVAVIKYSYVVGLYSRTISQTVSFCPRKVQ